MPQSKFGAVTHVGLIRSQNEDAILASAELGLWLVADGMGGHQGGEIASACARDAIAAAVAEGLPLPEAVHRAHRTILDAVATGQGKPGMGSTVVALSSRDHQLQIAWVGDSRAYLLQQSDAPCLLQLTKDHSYVQTLVDSGLIRPEDSFSHPDKNVITQCLGSPATDSVKVDSIERPWRAGDRVLLCSDGLTDCVQDSTLTAILTDQKDSQAAAQALLAEALANGGKDNVSVIVIDAPQDRGDGWRHSLKELFDRD